ncbi:MAG: PP2C family protein-serine/threonine phosphatase, partial [Nitrospinota bacterium]
GFLILDVAGHGIASAFIAAMAKMSVYHHAFAEASPGKVLSLVNRDLLSNIKTDHFVTCFYGIYDTEKRTLHYARGSHPPAFLLRKNSETLSLDADGFFLGVDEESVYEESKVDVGEGDRLFLYTDGIYEWELPSKKVFGQKNFNRLVATVGGKNIHEHVSDVLSEIIDRTDSADLDDDITLIGIQFH